MRQSFGAFAVVSNDTNKILLARRNEPDNSHPFHLKWNIPGGGIEFGEHPEETAIREVFEETGVTAKIIDKRPIVKSFINKEKDDQDILLFYKATYVTGDNQQNHEKGTTETKWFDYNAIDFSDCLPGMKELLDEILIIK